MLSSKRPHQSYIIQVQKKAFKIMQKFEDVVLKIKKVRKQEIVTIIIFMINQNIEIHTALLYCTGLFKKSHVIQFLTGNLTQHKMLTAF